MNTPRFVIAAVAAALFSTASFAAPPSADQVAVPHAQMHHGKIKALFESPDEFMMFRMQIREATHGMARDQKRAYRKAQIQKIKAMTGAERASWLHGLQAQWNALPADRKAWIARKMEAYASRHQARHGNQGDDQSDDQMDQSR